MDKLDNPDSRITWTTIGATRVLQVIRFYPLFPAILRAPEVIRLIHLSAPPVFLDLSGRDAHRRDCGVETA